MNALKNYGNAALIALLVAGALARCEGAITGNSKHAAPKVIWGAATNFIRGAVGSESGRAQPLPTSLRAGVEVSGGVIVLSGRPPTLASSAYLVVENLAKLNLPANEMHTIVVSPTNMVLIYLPPAHERLLLEMTNSAGVRVQRTPLGLTFGRPLTLKAKTFWMEWPRRQGTMAGLFPRPGYQGLNVTERPKSLNGRISEKELLESGILNPLKFFKLERPGRYTMTIVLRFYIEDTNTFLVPIALPPVTVPVRVEGNDNSRP